MFTPADRDHLRNALISAASADERIVAAALTGSGAVGAEDRWSDIDLALSLATDADRGRVVSDWTDRLYQEHGAVAHLDLHHGGVQFRVFMLASTMQVDLAFWPATEFGAIAPTFRLLFGSANERPMLPPPSTTDLIGMGWLYALHARSSIARGQVWQAEYMVSGMRDQVLALACLRHGLPAVQGRGIDRLPPDVKYSLAGGLVNSLEEDELTRAFGVITEALLREVSEVDAGLADRLANPLRQLPIAEPSPAPDPARDSAFRSS